MTVVILLAVIWAVVLVPPAVRSQRARRKAFEVSFGRPVAPAPEPVIVASPAPPHSPTVRRRRRIAGGLLAAMVVTGLAGLLPPFRTLLPVHLFLDDSFLFYVALLAYRADRRATAEAPGAARVGVREPQATVSPRRRRQPVARPVVLDLPPVASAR